MSTDLAAAGLSGQAPWEPRLAAGGLGAGLAAAAWDRGWLAALGAGIYGALNAANTASKAAFARISGSLAAVARSAAAGAASWVRARRLAAYDRAGRALD